MNAEPVQFEKTDYIAGINFEYDAGCREAQKCVWNLEQPSYQESDQGKYHIHVEDGTGPYTLTIGDVRDPRCADKIIGAKIIVTDANGVKTNVPLTGDKWLDRFQDRAVMMAKYGEMMRSGANEQPCKDFMDAYARTSPHLSACKANIPPTFAPKEYLSDWRRFHHNSCAGFLAAECAKKGVTLDPTDYHQVKGASTLARGLFEVVYEQLREPVLEMVSERYTGHQPG